MSVLFKFFSINLKTCLYERAGIALFKILCIFLMPLFISACSDDENPDNDSSPSIIMHNSDGTAYFSYLREVPPGEVYESKSLFSFNSTWGYRALSISPTGKYGAIAIFSQQGASRTWEGKIHIYNTSDGGVYKEYNKAAFISLMNFPVADASMVVANLYWMNEKELLVHLQPQTPWIESVPQNASLIIDVENDSAVDLKYSSRTGPFSIQAPDHVTKTLYTSEIRQNKLYIDGNAVADLPDVGAYDIYFGEN